MIKVHKFGPAFGLPDASPFVTKVETYLRMTGQEYETVSADVRKAPRTQLPYVEVEGEIIPDSTKIVTYLESKRAEKMDAHLSESEKAVGQAFKSMLEEHVYFIVLYMRWATDDGWAVFQPTLKEMLGKMGVPSFLRGMVSKTARKQVVGRTSRQGVGRAPRAEIVAAGNTIFDALAVQMGDRAYFAGDKPSTYDATVYPFVAGILCPAFDHEIRKHVASKTNLVAYADRMKEAYWKD
jgi:glutathione S-transferase